MKNENTKIYRPGIKTYTILIILFLLISLPFLILKIYELRCDKIFFKGNDFYKCAFLCFLLIFVLWLELCAIKVELTDDRIIYTEHIFKKKYMVRDSIKSIKFGVGTLVITSDSKDVIEINLNSLNKQDVITIIKSLKNESPDKESSI